MAHGIEVIAAASGSVSFLSEPALLVLLSLRGGSINSLPSRLLRGDRQAAVCFHVCVISQPAGFVNVH